METEENLVHISGGQNYCRSCSIKCSKI